jgi:transposase
MADRRIPIEQFLPLYLKAVEEGMTKEQFAKKIGVKPATVYQRVYELRRAGAELPSLPAATRRSLSERVRDILAEHQGGNGKAKAKPAKVKEVVEETEEQADPLADILS